MEISVLYGYKTIRPEMCALTYSTNSDEKIAFWYHYVFYWFGRGLIRLSEIGS